MASTVYLPIDISEETKLPAGAYSTRDKALDVAENEVRLLFSKKGITDYQLFRGETFVDGWSEKLEANFYIQKLTIR